MAEALRAVSNLTIPEEFKLTKSERNSGFLFLYNSRFSEQGYEVVFSLIFQPLFEVTRIKDFLSDKKKLKPDALFKELQLDKQSRRAVLKRTGHKDKNDGFIFFVPLFTNDITVQERQQFWLERVLTYEQRRDLEITHKEIVKGFHPTNKFLNSLVLSSHTIHALNKCLLGLEVTEDGEVWAKFFISKREAEFLTSTKYAAIRPSNLFVPLQMWAGSAFGTTASLPVSSLPISHIKNEVAKIKKKGLQETPRNKFDNICVLEDGNMVWIPDVDSAIEYEQALHTYGIQDDGSYTFSTEKTKLKEFHVHEDEEEKVKKLPANMPVFTDWVNLKFAYSLTTGILDVLDLERTVQLKAYHVRNFLDTGYEDDSSREWAHLITALKVAMEIDPSIQVEPSQGEMEWGKLQETDTTLGPVAYIERAISRIISQRLVEDEIRLESDIKIKHFSSNSPCISLRPVGRALQKALKACEDNIDNVYKRYAVWTTVQFIARIKLFAKYADKFDAIKQKDEKNRDLYLKQGLDPKHKPDAIPNIKNDFGMLPHQAKGENLLRGSPQFAIWSVSAGGGKTLSILANILLELKKKHAKRPLVLCPAHLVADYIKESVFLTEGKVNMIAITTQSMRYHGAERLTKIITIAPSNTVFVTDYNFIKGKGEDIGYGIKTMTVYRNVEFLRMFSFDLICIDESHFLKNVSLRSESAHRFIAEIPMKRLASGTLVHDVVTDIVAQFALLDPTVFGDKEKFMREFALEVRGGKVMAWKPNAQQNMHRRMREHCVFIDAKRKEWAVLLPDPEEVFHGVELTERQMVVYKSVLEYTMDLIQKAIEKDPKLRKALAEAEDENKFESLAALLKPYLSRLEQFLAAPARDPLGKELLTDDADKMSPKNKKIIQLIRKHLGQKHVDKYDPSASFQSGKQIFGKILIFTNHIEVAEEIYETLPTDIKKMTILYKAGQKMEARAEFENNPNKMVMVGVEKSMNTGLNFQFVSRLIRVETVWTPGELEQGNSRINRPELKKKEKRKNIYFDWIIVNKTFDITKGSRLIAKMIQNAKFEEPENQRYQDLPDVDLIPMNLTTIQEMNDWTSTLESYLEAYKAFKTIQAEDYEEYRKKNIDKMEPVEIPNAGILPNSKLMSRVPYVPGMELYGTDQLGLVRYDEYMRRDIEYEIEDEEAGDEEDEGELTSREKNKEELKRVMGLAVHTEWGDGEVIGLARFMLKVRLHSGAVVRSRKLATFVITRKSTNAKDMRTQLLKMAGKLPIDAPIDVPADKGLVKRSADVKKKDLPPKAEEEDETVVTPEIEGEEIELNFTIINDFLGISFKQLNNSNAVSILTNLGFKIAPEYFYTRLKTLQNVVDLVKTWKKKGFVYPGYLNQRMKQLYDTLKNKAQLKTFGLANKLGLKNFYIREFKPGSSPKEIKPYPLILGDGVYIALPAQAQIGTRNAIKLTVPGIVWKHSKKSELVYFVLNKDEAKRILKKILDSGLEISNKKELKKQFDKLKVVKRKASDKE